MKNSIKREQSQACLNFAERKNFRLQAKYKILMTLALLITAVGGAWAQDYDINVDFNSTYDRMGTTFNCMIMSMDPGAIKGTLELSVDGVSKGSFGVDGEMVFGSIAAIDAGDHTWTAEFKPEGGGSFKRHGDFRIDKVHTSISYNGSTSINMGVGESTELDVHVAPDGADGLSYSSSDASVVSITKENSFRYIIQAEAAGTATITFSFAGNKNYEAAEEDITITVTVLPAPIEVTPGEAANTWTFAMPGSDVVLTPIYAAATLYQNDGETEKQAYETLKEAFANVQDGDVIKLDWDVTLTEDLATPTIEGGVKFTLDFNGYTLDFGTTYQIKLQNDGDQLTFTDSSDDQLGGLIAENFNIKAGREYVFVAGRYNICGTTAERLNVFFCANPSIPFSVAEGKEFVDLEGGAEANDGFTVRVGFKTYELTIGAGKFATFYADQNTTLDEGQNIGFYTISSIDADRSTATVTQINSTIIPANTPTLVYNGGNDQQTVKIKVTPDEADAENQGISPLENFMGTAVAKTFTEDDMAAADYYALSGGKLFVPVYDAGTIGKNQCWLQFNHANGAPARGITLVFEKEEATEVTEVLGKPSDQGRASEVNEAGDGAWYDLSGRKLNAAPIKGVYIKDGKKIVK